MATGVAGYKTKYYIPKWGVPEYKKPPHHSLFGNLLRDVVDIPKGIIPGTVAMVKHPIRSVEQMVEAEKALYGPALHGEWGKFWGNVSAHPLQPILDAVSVLTLGAGGAGVLVKGADTLINGGRMVEIRAAMSMADKGNKTVMAMGKTGQEWNDLYIQASKTSVGISKFGQEQMVSPGLRQLSHHFRKGSEITTKAIATDIEGYPIYKSYSQNLFTRALQKHLWEKGFTWAAKPGKITKKGTQINPLAKGGVYDYTAAGRAKRELKLVESKRTAATGETKRKQVRYLKAVHEAAQAEYRAGKITEDQMYATIDRGVSELLKETDLGVGISGERVPVHLATELTTEENPLRYEMDQSKIVQPKGEIHYQPSEGNVPGEGVTSIHMPDGSIKKIKGDVTKKRSSVKGKQQIVLPRSAFHAMQKESSGRADVLQVSRKDWQDGTAYEKLMDKIGSRYEGTTDPRMAKVYTDPHTGEKYYNMIRKDSINKLQRELTAEGVRVKQTMNAIFHTPIKVWKYMVLSLSPRYIVNNLTNYLMYAMSANPVAVTRGIIDAVKYSRGVKAAAKLQEDMGNFIEAEVIKYTGGKHGWYHQHFAGIHASNYGSGIQSGNFHKVAGFGFKFVEDYIYAPSMMAGTMTAMRSIPAVRDLERRFRSQGMSPTEAFNAAAMQMSADPATHSMVMKMVGDWAGQYYHLNGFEKMLMAIVPFYNWDRHALRFAKTLVMEHPTTSAVLAHLGTQGNEWTEKELGKLPDFMKGAIPFDIPRAPGLAGTIQDVILGAQQPGRKKILLTHGLNPLAAAGENIHALAGLVGAEGGKEALGSQLNPLVAGMVEGVTGQNLVTGSKSRGKFLGINGPIGVAAHNIFTTAAPAKILIPALHAAGGTVGLGSGGWGTPKPKPNKRTGKITPFLYTKSESDNIRNWFGLNAKQYDKGAAAALYNKQHHIKSNKDTRSILTVLNSFDYSNPLTATEVSGFKVKKRFTKRARKQSAFTKPKFPALSSKGGIRGISGIGGI